MLILFKHPTLLTVQMQFRAHKKAHGDACSIFLAMKNVKLSIHGFMAFNDKATFHVSENANKHHRVFRDKENPHIARENERESLKVNVWCAITAAGVVRSHFCENSTFTRRHFLHMMETFTVEMAKNVCMKRSHAMCKIFERELEVQ